MPPLHTLSPPRAGFFLPSARFVFLFTPHYLLPGFHVFAIFSPDLPTT